MKSTMAGGAALLLVGASAPAAALTAEQAWAAAEAGWEALGLSLEATLAREGRVVIATGPRASVALFGGLATLEGTAPDLILTETADGRVAFDWAEAAGFGLVLAFRGQEAIQARASLRWIGRSAAASGTAGDVTFAAEAERLDITAQTHEDGAALGAPGATQTRLAISQTGFAGTARVVQSEGGAVEVTLDQAAARTVWETETVLPDGSTTRMVGESAPDLTTLRLVRPAGIDPGEALRAGLSVVLASRSAGHRGEAVLLRGGEAVETMPLRQDPFELRLALGRDGLSLAATIGPGTAFVAPGAALVAAALSHGEIAFALELPLLAADGPQPLRLAARLDDVALADGSWDALDPSAALDRGPWSLDLALAGEAVLSRDLLDPATWGALARAAGAPFHPLRLSLDRFEARGLGVVARASGLFAFDPAERSPIPGLPRPQGQLGLTVTGLQALLDAALSAGWILPEEARAARLGLGMVLRAIGPDEAVLVFEATPDGRLLLNGLPLD
jgi:hypothetical protein